jgi:hypothetical protein
MRYLGISSTVLALLIALISVSQSAAPVFLRMIKGQYTALKLNLLSIGDINATFLATNSGSMPGRLGEVFISPGRGNVPPTAYARFPEFHIGYARVEGLINPGEMREISLRLNPDVSNECSVDPTRKRGEIDTFDGYMYMDLIGYDGDTSQQKFEVSIYCPGLGPERHWEFVPTTQFYSH